ncbi:MAG: TatD family hydrolase [Kiritimatiellae bacterium]|nr:TatD family hydrolase [Kiritimatiellia bacterium]
MLTDTHVHFDGMIAAGDTIGAIVTRATQAGVSHMMAIGGSMAANHMAIEIARSYDTRIRATVGFNRDLAAVVNPMDELKALLAAPEVVAVGEIGLDFHHSRDTMPAQIELFRHMLTLARDRRLPVCVHTREAEAETLAALREHAAAWSGPAGRIGVMHCFTGGEGFTRDLLALGLYISFSGIITFKKSGSLREVAARVPEDRLLIETDAPYLAPEPFRGQPNEPSHVRRVAEALAEIRHMSLEKIAEVTTRNAERLFGR